MQYALITGASKGIGKEIAIELAKRGYHLLLVARSSNLLAELAGNIQQHYAVSVDYCAIDLAKTNAAKTLFNWCSEKNYSIHILVNNAGYGLSGLFSSYSIEEHQAMMQVNMQVPVELVHSFLPMLQKQNKAYILNIASSAAYQAVPGLSVYAASKAFILNFSRGLQYELRNTKVSVTAVSPGATDTDFPNRANVGEKALKTAEKVNMSAEEVAKIAVNAMFTKKTEVVAGFINQLGAFLVWLLPKKLAEKTAAGIYNL
ncbi:MAG: SDR family NAD(P)-dependent oxidoreductase [Chitinophagaceae bacterium]